LYISGKELFLNTGMCQETPKGIRGLLKSLLAIIHFAFENESFAPNRTVVLSGARWACFDGMLLYCLREG
jgi:hypothetical protein